MEIIIFFVALFILRYLLSGKGKSTKPKAVGNEYLNNPKPLFPSFDRETIAWNTLNTIFGLSKPKTTTHGSAEFMSQSDLSRLINTKNKGLVVDGTNRLPLDFNHYAIIGGTGSGKTTKILTNNLLQANINYSYVVSDPSGECLLTCGKTLIEKGFNILVINLEGTQKSQCYNPLSRCTNSKEIMKIADIIVSSGSDSNDTNAQFWNDGASLIIYLIIKALKNTTHCTLANVRYILNTYNPSDNRVLDHFMATNLINPADIQDYLGAMANDVKVISGFISSAKASLKPLADDYLARLTSEDTIDFYELRKSPTCLFIQYPEHQTQYYQFMIKIIYTQFFDMCMSTGLHGKPSRPIMVHLDEFANIGKLPLFSSLITTLRKRSLCVHIYLQSLEQVGSIYGNRGQSEAILAGGIGTHIYLNALSHSTCQQLSQRIGDFTVEDAEKGHKHGRNLITASELRLMGDDTCLMLHKNMKPVMFKVTPYYKNKKLLKLSQKPLLDTDLSYAPLPNLEFIPLAQPPQPIQGNSNSSNIKFDL